MLRNEIDDEGLLLRFGGRNREIDRERGLPDPPFCEITAAVLMRAWCHDGMRPGMREVGKTKGANCDRTSCRTQAFRAFCFQQQLMPDA